jgi:hypothetical protein
MLHVSGSQLCALAGKIAGQLEAQGLAPRTVCKRSLIQHFWEYLKDRLSWKLFKDLKELQEKVCELMVNTTKEVIASLSGYPWILDSLNRAGI